MFAFVPLQGEVNYKVYMVSMYFFITQIVERFFDGYSTD